MLHRHPKYRSPTLPYPTLSCLLNTPTKEIDIRIWINNHSDQILLSRLTSRTEDTASRRRPSSRMTPAFGRGPEARRRGPCTPSGASYSTWRRGGTRSGGRGCCTSSGPRRTGPSFSSGTENRTQLLLRYRKQDQAAHQVQKTGPSFSSGTGPSCLSGTGFQTYWNC